MKRLLGLAIFLGLAAVVSAQNTSQVVGRVTDVSSAVMPGVTVILSSPALLEPRIAVTSVTGSYEFPGLPIGLYSVRFELEGRHVPGGDGRTALVVWSTTAHWFWRFA